MAQEFAVAAPEVPLLPLTHVFRPEMTANDVWDPLELLCCSISITFLLQSIIYFFKPIAWLDDGASEASLPNAGYYYIDPV